MNSLNITFLEEYKYLDKLCKEMFMTEKGISDYIDTSVNNFNLSHNSDIKTLRRLRHIRNSLTHDTDTFNTQMCTESDINWLKDFYQKVFTASDPLSLCIKQEFVNSGHKTKLPTLRDKTDVSSTHHERTTRGSKAFSAFLLFALAGITVLLALFYLLR